MAIPGIGQMQDLYKMQREAKKMEKEMKQIVVKGYSKNEKISVTLDGTQEVVAVKIAEDMLEPDQKKDVEQGIKEAHKEASKKLQKEMMKGMDMDKIRSMLGS
ncbi:YbaB/EbfC family nucleoid-associated protein [Candidatus Dojkabacteria bacterium]|uniref:YbaB/EbfC family nucleoid-associated protein n=1 Tax=Candidatus Dojkabacteria bacterium TaxID=2099670 RepID=A0A955RI46_9BACT|nr:YbaB/EbfC family nucleoid-associated protein [Candidatus Dojkabacteria bacterium]